MRLKGHDPATWDFAIREEGEGQRKSTESAIDLTNGARS